MILQNKNFGGKFSTFELLNVIVGAPRADGYSIAELQEILELRKLIDISKTEIELTKKQVEKIQQFVKGHKFGAFDEAFIEFANQINNV